MTHHQPSDEHADKNAPFRSARRSARRTELRRPATNRKLVVRGQLRDKPDVHKLARAIIAVAVADAEAERQAEAEAARRTSPGTMPKDPADE